MKTKASPLTFTSFGEMLHYLRRSARLTQRDLAIAAGHSESMISRLEQDVLSVAQQLARARLVTRTGPGGCGKTSLAVEVGRQLAESGLTSGRSGATASTLWPPLAAPDLHPLPILADIADFPAVQLFIQRSQAVMPSLQLTEQNAAAVAQFCALLDGIPLALELGTAATATFSVQEIAARLGKSVLLARTGSEDAVLLATARLYHGRSILAA